MNKIIAVNWAPPFEGPLQNLSQVSVSEYFVASIRDIILYEAFYCIKDDIKAYYESYIEFSRFLNNHNGVVGV